MKKITALLLSAVLVFALIGCGGPDSSKGSQSGSLTGSEPGGGTDNESGNNSVNEPGNNVDGESGNGAGSSNSQLEIYPNERGVADGHTGDLMHTAFFDFTVNDVYLCSQYEGYTPEAGNKLLITNVTIKSTFTSSITMYDTDFMLQWKNDTDSYSFPVEGAKAIDSKALPAEYNLSSGAETSGILIYEVPADIRTFYVSYVEFFEDGSSGSEFYVSFTAEEK